MPPPAPVPYAQILANHSFAFRSAWKPSRSSPLYSDVFRNWIIYNFNARHHLSASQGLESEGLIRATSFYHSIPTNVQKKHTSHSLVNGGSRFPGSGFPAPPHLCVVGTLSRHPRFSRTSYLRDGA